MINSLPSAFSKEDGASSVGGGSGVVAAEGGGGGGDGDCPKPYTSGLERLPLILLMAYIFFFNLGFGAMIWITVAEILPMKVRADDFFS